MGEGECPHNLFNWKVKAGVLNVITQDTTSPDAEDRTTNSLNHQSSIKRQRSGKVYGPAVRGGFGSPALEQTGWTKLTDDTKFCVANPVSPGSRVFRGRQKHYGGRHKDVIVKLLEISPNTEQEVARLLDLDHPNIVRIIQSGRYLGSIPEIFIVMETCLMDLKEYAERNKGQDLSFKKSFSYSKQLSEGVNYIHQKNIVHRDLKPPNILISKCEHCIKISDFGISKVVPKGADAATVTNINAGTEGFKAPETYKGVAKYSYKADIFPLGLCIYYIFTNGQHPFGENYITRAYNIMENKNPDLSQIPMFQSPNTDISQMLLQLIESTLQHKPASRPTTSEILKHEFFSEAEVEVLTKNISSLDVSPSKSDKEKAKNEVRTKRFSYAEPSSLKPDDKKAKIEALRKRFSCAEPSSLKPDEEKTKVEDSTKEAADIVCSRLSDTKDEERMAGSSNIDQKIRNRISGEVDDSATMSERSGSPALEQTEAKVEVLTTNISSTDTLSSKPEKENTEVKTVNEATAVDDVSSKPGEEYSKVKDTKVAAVHSDSSKPDKEGTNVTVAETTAQPNASSETDEESGSWTVDRLLNIAERELVLKRGLEEDSIQQVKDSFFKSGAHSHNDAKKMARNLNEKGHHIRAMILFYISYELSKSQNISSNTKLIMMNNYVAGIKIAIEPLIDGGPSHYIAENYGYRYMKKLLNDIVSVKTDNRSLYVDVVVECMSNFTYVAYILGKFEDVILFCHKSISMTHNFSRIVSDSKFYGMLLNNLGSSYRGLNEYSKAKRCYLKAIEALSKSRGFKCEEEMQEAKEFVKENLEEVCKELDKN